MKGKPKPRPKPGKLAPASPEGASAAAGTHSPCACGGDCPHCRARAEARRKADAAPRNAPAALRPAPADPAEREAQDLGRRLSLIGEPAARPADKVQTDPAAPRDAARPRPALRTMRAPHPQLSRSRRLTRNERVAAEASLGFDMGAVCIHTGPVADALADRAGALAFTLGNHIVLGSRVGRMSPAARSRVVAHELIHVVQQTAPVLPAASSHERPEARGPPLRPFIRGPPHPQFLSRGDLLNYAGAVVETVTDYGSGAVDGVVEFAEDAGDTALAAVRKAVDLLAPGLWDFLSGGALEDMADLLCDGVDAVLGTLFDGIADIDIMSSLEETFKSLATGVTTAQAAATEAVRNAVGAMFEPFVKALEKWGGPLITFIQTLTSAVSGAFTGAWNKVAVPAMDFLEAAGGAVWKTFTGLVTWVWDLIAPLREQAAWAWEKVTEYFEIAWTSTADIRKTLEGYASEAFKAFLKLIEPIKTPLMVAGGILLALSPLGPIVVASLVVPPLWQKITWLAQNWTKLDVVVEARQYLHDVILPGIIGVVDGVKAVLVGAANWLAGVLGILATAMVRVVSAFSGNSCLKAVKRIIKHIEDQVTRFQKWANGGFAGLNDALGAAFDALKALFQPILDFLVRLLMVAVNPFMLPFAITAAVWLLLPDRLKPAVIKFVLQLILAAVEAMPAFLPGLIPLAAVMKSATIGFLRHLLGDAVTDDQRIAASNKIANLATGGGVQFVAGFAVGILQGLIDGIIDPFKLLFMLFELVIKGVEVVGRVVSRLVPLISPSAPAVVQSAVRAVVGPPPPTQQGAAAAPAPATEQAQAQATGQRAAAGEYGIAARQAAVPEGAATQGAIVSRQTANGAITRRAEAPAAPTEAEVRQPDPSTDPVRREIRAIRPVDAQPQAPQGGAVSPGTAQGGQGQISARRSAGGEIRRAPAANSDAAPGPVAAEETAAPAAATGAGEIQAVGGGEEVALDSDLTDEQIVAYMSPAALQASAPAAEGEVSAAGLEQGMRGEVRSGGSSVRGLARLLGDAWDALLAGAGKLGGMAAGWLMEFLALPDYELGNKLGYLAGMILLEALIAYFTAGGYLVIKEGASIGARLLAYFLRFLDMGGAILGILGKGLGKLRRPIMGGLDAAGGFLSRFKFLDKVIGRVRGAADWLFSFGDEIGHAADLARRGPVDDAAGRGVMGLADDAAEGVARGADEVPALLPRVADDVPTGPVRVADDVPAGPARVADEAPVTPSRRADEAAEAGSDRAARDAIDEAGGKPPRNGLDEAPDGTRRTADDAPPTIRDEAKRAAEFPVALTAARQIAEINDAADQPIPVVMAALMALKTRYRWIDHFVARPISGRGVYFIGMVASPQTPVDRHYSVHATPEPPPPRAADPLAWRTPPSGGRVVSDGPTHVVYELPDGSKRIRFDARDARTFSTAQPGRNQTDEALAAVSPDGRPYVHEGRHRSVGAAKGDAIPEGAGGVPGHPEVLDYPYSPDPAPSGGMDLRNLKIDYDVPDMDPVTLGHYTDATDMRFRDPKARALSGPDRELGDPRRAREIADEVIADAANAPQPRLTQKPDGGLRADPAGHSPRSNLDAKPGQLAGAITAAHSIVGLNDRLNTPLPAIMAQLMALKSRYRWIETFEAQPIGPGRFRFFMIASRSPVGTADLLDLPDGSGALPRGSTVHSGPEGAGYRPPSPEPEVVTLPPGARRPAGPAPEASAAPRPARDRLPEADNAPRRSTSEEIQEEFSETTRGNGAMVPTGRSQNARIPDYPGRTERHTGAVMNLENNRVFGATNEDFFTRYLDEGLGEGAERFDNVAQQVYIRPIIGWDDLGRPRYAGYRVRVDNLARDRASGGLQILDAKTTPRAPLTPNQKAGYPLIAANGGRVETPGLPRGLEHMSDIDPTPVARAIPTTNLRTGALPANGRPNYDIRPIEPAGGVGGPRVVPVTPKPHPAPSGPVSRGTERSGQQIGEDIVRAPPSAKVRQPTPVGEGSLRAAEEPGVTTVRNAAQKAAQLPEALAAARTIIAAGDAVNLPAPVILGQLMLLKRRYRWVESFRADPAGPTSWTFVLIASQIRIATADLGDPLVLFHGSPRPGAVKLAHAIRDPRQGFMSSVRDHDIGQGLYLFEDALGAAHYAGDGGTILRIEIPRPHPEDIADISLQGFGRGGLPGAERDLFLRQPGLDQVPSAADMQAKSRFYRMFPADMIDDLPAPNQMMVTPYREKAKNFTSMATSDQASPFFRNLARAQLFHGTLPPHAQLAAGGLAFEYDIIQWRMRAPTDEVRRQIIRQILGL